MSQEYLHDTVCNLFKGNIKKDVCSLQQPSPTLLACPPCCSFIYYVAP